jgi:hypothetical protein
MVHRLFELPGSVIICNKYRCAFKPTALISIIGPEITGGTFKTAKNGERIEITGNRIRCYNAAGN